MSTSRRDFLRQLSAAAAFGAVDPVPLRALWARTPGEIIPEVNEGLLRELALVAVEAARAAGAEFADVRLSALREYWLTASFDRSSPQRPYMRSPILKFPTDYGIRARVDGAWGFAGGYTLAPEAVAELAQLAVSRARTSASRRGRSLDLAPVPRVEDGSWATPIEQDPFHVTMGDQADHVLTALAAGEGVRGVRRGTIQTIWKQTLHVFASSEGSLIAQRFSLAQPAIVVSGKSRDEHIENGGRVEGVRYGGYGYEAVSHAGLDLVAGFRQAAERAVAGSGPPGPAAVPVEVGRYDLVLGPVAVAVALRQTLVPALNLERALGYQANREGTSFAAPPAEILDKYPVASPLVTLRADRTRPHATATVGWDDEGVPAGEHTLIQDGVVVDYLTSRQTAVELASLYHERGEAVRSRGCTLGRGQERPEVPIPRYWVPNVTLDPGPEDLSLDDLVAGTKRGFYVPQTEGGGSDQQLLSGQFKGRDVREIRDGKLGRPMKDFAFQFLTPEFWKKLDALGGSSSAGARDATTRVVPVRVREVNVLNTGITL